MTAPGNAVAVQEQPGEKKGVVALFEKHRTRIEPFLPRGVTLDRVAAATYLAIRNDPTGKLKDCDPESLVLAAAKVCQWDLEIGDTAHLVPFGGKATAIADYKGLAELVQRSGAARSVNAHPVFAGDHFELTYGSAPSVDHRPATDARTRGELIGAYAVFRRSFGDLTIAWVPIADVEAIRQKYSKQWKSGPCPPWYAVKTAIRQGVKLLPKTAKFAVLLRTVEDDEAVELGDGASVPAGVSDGGAMRYALPGQNPRGTQLSAGYGYEDEGPAHGIPTREAGKPSVDPAVLARHANTPDPYSLEDDEFALDDQRQAPRAPNAQERD